MQQRVQAGWALACRVKQRCEISICTAAELPYAYEAWRNLDPDFCLLPVQDARRRIVTVGGKGLKTLERALGMEQQLVLTARSPFAVVVDDRKEVAPSWHAAMLPALSALLLDAYCLLIDACCSCPASMSCQKPGLAEHLSARAHAPVAESAR